MNNVDEFIAAQERLEKQREERWAAAIARQAEWDKHPQVTGKHLLKFLAKVTFWAVVIGGLVWMAMAL